MFAHQPARQDAHARLRGMLPHCRPEQEDKRAESKRMIHFFEAGLAKMSVGNPFETCSVPSCDLRAPLLRSKAGFKHFSANKQCLPRRFFLGGYFLNRKFFRAASCKHVKIECANCLPSRENFQGRNLKFDSALPRQTSITHQAVL